MLKLHRHGVGQCSPQNLVSFSDGAGWNNGDLDSGWHCVRGERLEDAHPGSDLPTHTLSDTLVVLDLYIFKFLCDKLLNLTCGH